MKKGFTLVELLMVVVIVGVLVLIALPKYQTAVEKGRALEGIHNACEMTEYIAIHKDIDEEWDPSSVDMDQIKSNYFDLDLQGDTVVATRNGTDWNYKIYGDNCINTNGSSDCERLDLTGNLCSL